MTIEERANSFASAHHKMYVNAREGCIAEHGAYKGYIQGVTDQRKIDIDKACEALYILQDELNADLMDIEQAKEIMRKAMEE